MVKIFEIILNTRKEKKRKNNIKVKYYKEL